MNFKKKKEKEKIEHLLVQRHLHTYMLLCLHKQQFQQCRDDCWATVKRKITS